MKRPKTFKTNPALKNLWGIWLFAALAVAACPLLLTVPRGYRFQITLNPGYEKDITFYRLLSTRFGPKLEFSRETDPDRPGYFKRRPELGDFGSKVFYDTPPGKKRFEDSGAPVKLSIFHKESGHEFVFETLPAGSYSKFAVSRRLALDDGDPLYFDYREYPRLPSGILNLNLKVLEVGESLIGEQVTFLIPCPVSIKDTQAEYTIFFFAMFWQIYAFILLVLLMPLALMTFLYRDKAK